MKESDVEKGTSSFALFILFLTSFCFDVVVAVYMCMCVRVCKADGERHCEPFRLSVSLYLTSERA